MSFLKILAEFFFKYYAAFPSILVLIFYILTLAPGVIASDAGELAAVQYTLGIAHPTGYPLFTILGFLFSRLPIPLKPILKLNLLTAIWSVLTIYILIHTIKNILDNYKKWIVPNANLPEKLYLRFDLPERTKIIAAVFGGLVLGFSKSFWFNSLSVEVYSLHIFLFSLTFYFIVKAFINKDLEEKTPFYQDSWFWAFVFLSLGFTNHLSTLFIVPAFLSLFFNELKFLRKRIKKFLIYSAAGFSILTLVYLYIPIRSNMQPYLNWGNPVTFIDFINHISGRLYHRFLFPSFTEYISNIGKFLNTMTINFDNSAFQGSDFSIVIIVSFLGMIVSAIFLKRLFYLLMLIFAATIFISSLYNIPDIHTYYLAGHFVIGIFSSIGFVYLASMKLKQKIKFIALAFIFTFSILFEINQNYSRVDLSENTLMDDYTLHLLNAVEKNSIIFSARSSFYFPSLYYQLVEDVRRDVVVADYILLKHKWYYNQLNKMHPNIIVLRDTIASLDLTDRAVYFSQEMLKLGLINEVRLKENLELVPVQFLFKLVPKGTYVEADFPDYKFKFVNPHLFESNDIKNIILNMLLNRAIYELMNDKIEESKKYIKKIKQDFPDYELPPDLAELLREE